MKRCIFLHFFSLLPILNSIPIYLFGHDDELTREQEKNSFWEHTSRKECHPTYYRRRWCCRSIRKVTNQKNSNSTMKYSRRKKWADTGSRQKMIQNLPKNIPYLMWWFFSYFSFVGLCRTLLCDTIFWIFAKRGSRYRRCQKHFDYFCRAVFRDYFLHLILSPCPQYL